MTVSEASYETHLMNQVRKALGQSPTHGKELILATVAVMIPRNQEDRVTGW